MTIFDVRITNFMATSYLGRYTYHALQTGENINKRKHLQAFLEARKNFTPLVFSKERCMGRETQVSVKRMAALLRNNWDQE